MNYYAALNYNNDSIGATMTIINYYAYELLEFNLTWYLYNCYLKHFIDSSLWWYNVVSQSSWTSNGPCDLTVSHLSPSFPLILVHNLYLHFWCICNELFYAEISDNVVFFCVQFILLNLMISSCTHFQQKIQFHYSL